MRLKDSTNGQVPPIGIFMIIIGVLLVGLLAWKSVGASAFTPSIPSLTPTEPSCKVKDIGVRIKGDLTVSDNDWYTVLVDPAPEQVSVNEVRKYNTLGILRADYSWEVCMVDLSTNNKVSCDDGTERLENKMLAKSTQSVPYALDFRIPDNDCDNEIDDFDGKIVATVRLAGGKEKTIEQSISFRNGKFITE